jgi:hypothetical protein
MGDVVFDILAVDKPMGFLLAGNDDSGVHAGNWGDVAGEEEIC